MVDTEVNYGRQTDTNTERGGTLALCCCIASWCFYCLVSSEKTLPTVASTAERSTKFSVHAWRMPMCRWWFLQLAWCSKAVLVFWSRCLAPLSRCCDWEHQADTARSAAESKTKLLTLHPHTLLVSHVDGDAKFKLIKLYFLLSLTVKHLQIWLYKCCAECVWTPY